MGLLFLGNKNNAELLVENSAIVAGYAGGEALIWAAQKGWKIDRLTVYVNTIVLLNNF